MILCAVKVENNSMPSSECLEFSDKSLPNLSRLQSCLELISGIDQSLLLHNAIEVYPYSSVEIDP